MKSLEKSRKARDSNASRLRRCGRAMVSID